MISKILDWACKSKAKTEDIPRPLLGPDNSETNELWVSVIATETSRIASIDEFDGESIDAIYKIAQNQWVSSLITKNRRGNQWLYIAGDENPDNVSFCWKMYPQAHLEQYAINFGHAGEGVEVIKSRYNLVNDIFRGQKSLSIAIRE